MKTNALIVSSILCIAGISASAQQEGSARAAWFSKMGVERSGDDYVYTGPDGRVVLTADQVRRLGAFEATLESSPDGDAMLRSIDRDERAVPGIILKAASIDAANGKTPGKEPSTAMERGVSRVDGVLADSANPSFDGAVSAKSVTSIPAAFALSPSYSSSNLQPSSQFRPLDAAAKELPDAPKPAKPAHTALEKDLFWSTWWGYHAAFAADFTTTGMVIGRGGYETDHLYTQFGNKNMAGVIGSAVAVHAIASVASVALYREAAKKHGVWRYTLEAAAIGLNSYGIGTHTWGAAHNVGVLNNWNSPK
jgi:hypothetical protein